MKRFLIVIFSVLSLLCFINASSAHIYQVPSGVYPTIHDAVTAASGSVDQFNEIQIMNPVITVTDEITLDTDFNSARRLVIKPSSALPRATIASGNPSVPVFHLVGFGGGFITLQDLDIVRNITNNYHLVEISEFTDVTIERCRIGSIWSVPGGAGWSNLRIMYPYRVIVRNCIFFAYYRGTFERGIHVFSITDPANSVFLYNNVVADYSVYGIQIQGTAANAAIVLRNNVVANHPDFPAASEPTCYRSEVGALPMVISTHNVAFASAGRVESIGAVQSIAGAANFITMTRAFIAPSFKDQAWIISPPWQPNSDFYRLEYTGPLHNQESDWGVTVQDGAPHAQDHAVSDDIERDPRPGGSPAHTDRGADQIEPPVEPVPALQEIGISILILAVSAVLFLGLK